jgi:hypothetical protein
MLEDLKSRGLSVGAFFCLLFFLLSVTSAVIPVGFLNISKTPA